MEQTNDSLSIPAKLQEAEDLLKLRSDDKFFNIESSTTIDKVVDSGKNKNSRLTKATSEMTQTTRPALTRRITINYQASQ